MRKVVGCFVVAIAFGALSACGTTNDADTNSSGTAASSSSTADASAGSSSTTAGTTAAGPKDEFIEAADAICTDVAKKTAALQIDLSAANTTDVAAQAGAIEQGATYGDEALAQLRALTPPPGEEATVSGFWDGIEAQVAGQREIASLVRANDLQGAQTSSQALKESGTQVNAQLEAYGFKACAN